MGDHLMVRWRARLSEQLGTFTGESLHSPAAHCIFSSHALYGLHTVCAMTASCVSERDACRRIYDALQQIIAGVTEDRRAALHMIAFELTLLNALGYGLDLQHCARTGTKEDLCYVSPRTGRAVSRQGAGPYAPRLLPLPSFFHQLLEEKLPDMDKVSVSDLENGFTLTEFFFLRHVTHRQSFELPYARALFIRESIRLWENYATHGS